MRSKSELHAKKILVVDDEPDILDTLSEILDMCQVVGVTDYAAAAGFLKTDVYDAAILDIMGVDGYQLLKLTRERKIPTLMLTSQALSSHNFKKSIRNGAYAYMPKEKMADVENCLTEIMLASKKGRKKSGVWFGHMKPYFDKKFGDDWQRKDGEFWQFFYDMFSYTKEELGMI